MIEILEHNRPARANLERNISVIFLQQLQRYCAMRHLKCTFILEIASYSPRYFTPLQRLKEDIHKDPETSYY